jgi:4-diphosphocytidyl-2-C-methyl-D-erythritol kinase
MSRPLEIDAPAKLNLGLEVVRRRPDGFHELVTVFQEIDLLDRLVLEAAAELTLDVTGLPVPGGGENLVLQAARLLADETGCRAGARLRLHKAIPTGSGLGGGSSDAAAALVGLDRLWGTALGHRGLRALAARLGSDVPFFLVGGTALGLGRGEVICPLPDLPPLVAGLLCPDESLSTPEVYRRGSFPLTGNSQFPIIERFAQYVADGTGLEELVRNDLQQAATELLPRIEIWCADLREAGALAVALSGSGSCVYGLFEEEDAARRAVEGSGDGARGHVCRFRSRSARKVPR